MGKRIIQSIFGIIALLLGIIALLPTMLSLHFINQLALKWVNTQLPQKLQAQHISASWLDGITIQGLKIQDTQEEDLIHFETVKVTVTLSALLKAHKINGTIIAESKELAFLGKTLTANIKCDIANIWDGPFKIRIQSPLLIAKATCQVTDGCLTLNKPLDAQYTLLTQMGARSTKPITLAIDPDGFSMPLHSFQLEKLCIKDLQLDLGVLYCKNTGIMAALLTLFNAKVTDEISLWATPIYAEIKDGMLLCKRFDMLVAGSFPVASWGKINLVADKIDMTLALTGVSLVQAFALGKLDPSYMIQLPIRGTLESPHIDTAAVTSKIAALRLMQSRLAFANPIGALFSVGSMVFDKVDAPPPPTTTPFPWKLK